MNKKVRSLLGLRWIYFFPFIAMSVLQGCQTSIDSGGKSINRSSMQKLQGHIPLAVKMFADRGKVEETLEIPITISLKLNHESELDRTLDDLYDVESPNFHRFLTPEEFRAKYSPTDKQIAEVQSFLLAGGVIPEKVSENRMLIQARGSIQNLNALFSTEIHQFQDNQKKRYLSPAFELQVPRNLSILGVHGLQNVSQFKGHSQQNHSFVSSHSATGPNGGLSPRDILVAYHFPSHLTGVGQTLALFELDGYDDSDILEYEKHFGLPAIPLQTILVGGATGTPGQGQAEVTLDLELMIGIAQGANKILIYEGENSEQGVLNTYSKIANDNLAQQVSTSWGGSEDQIPTSLQQAENNIFKQMAAQGQSLYAASGDSGAYDNNHGLSVNDPSSQPYVVGVGGTKLTTHEDGSYANETTWNTNGKQGNGAGGGGISTVWTQPKWQQGLATAQNLGSAAMRNIPDVSLNSDPSTGYAIYNRGQWVIYGGTSAAAPIWAAFTALVNQQRKANGLTVLGFPNPALYQIGKGSRYLEDFKDIADGSTNLHYPAVTGYDEATGWGSLDGVSLLQDLSQS